jgi:hypothetical protein
MLLNSPVGNSDKTPTQISAVVVAGEIALITSLQESSELLLPLPLPPLATIKNTPDA